jgi:hypothetical protein
MVPIDLRKGFASVTLRNFIGMAVISLDPSKGTLAREDLASLVRSTLREQKQPSETLKQISRNASAAKNPFVQFLPRLIKLPLYRLSYRFFGEALVTSHLSNLGPFEPATGLEDEVISVRFLPGGSWRAGIAVGVVSFGDRLTLGFGSLFEDDNFEQIFASLLVADHLVPARVDGSSFPVHSQHL